MKAITILQPFASLVSLEQKKIETRSWPTKYRGPLAIHAGKTIKPEFMNLAWNEPFFSALKPLHKLEDGNTSIQYPLGCIIATCNLVDCIKMTPEFIKTVKRPELDFGFYQVGRYAWILKDVKALDEPIPAKGLQRIWNWEG